jgi:putative ABC transport system permease protein
MAEASPILPVRTGREAAIDVAPRRSALHRARGPALTGRLAWRNLAHDRVRFVVTLVGVVFSVTLMTVQSGLLLGFAQTASALIDRSGADFWMVSRGTSNVDQSIDIPDRRRYRALAAPGIAAVDKLIVHFAVWRRPDGRAEPVIIVGFDLDSGVGGPWNVVAGSVADLRLPDSVIIDRLYAAKLGVERIGQSVEIAGHRARIVGLTDGIRAFTQSPYVFTSLKNAARYSGLGDDRTHYLLARAAPEADHAVVEGELRRSLPSIDVLSASRFSAMTARYWLLTTGAGAALVLGAALGVLVGVIVVAQTLYAATIERLSEFATLRAMGASNAYLNAIVLKQGLIAGALGYLLGLGVAALTVRAAADSTISLVLPWQLALGVGLATLLMCAGAALIAIRRIKRIDPTMVFR